MQEIKQALAAVKKQQDNGNRKIFTITYFLLKLIVLKLGELDDKFKTI